jgi:signal transduction histidine kinase
VTAAAPDTAQRLPITTDGDVVRVRQAVRALAQGARLSLVDQTKLVTAASELARNTLIYGGGGEAVLSEVTNGRRTGVRVEFRDDGPGIPDDMHEEAFRPFSRLDASRNQNRKGVGLGLAVARDVARSHGGDITLGRSDLGGLKASIRLPADRRAA